MHETRDNRRTSIDKSYYRERILLVVLPMDVATMGTEHKECASNGLLDMKSVRVMKALRMKFV